MALSMMEFKAREAASREALRWVNDRGVAESTEIIRGCACAFARALAGMIGRDEVRRLLDREMPIPKPVLAYDGECDGVA